MAETYGAVYDVNGSILAQSDKAHRGIQKAYPAGPASGRLILCVLHILEDYAWMVGGSNWLHTIEANYTSLLGCYVLIVERCDWLSEEWFVRADTHSPLGCSFQRFRKTFWWRRALRSRTMSLLSRISPLEDLPEVQRCICYNVCGGSGSWRHGG